MLSELTAALRALARARGYTISVVLILSLGLGSTTAIYSMVEGSIFQQETGLPEPDRLVRLDMNSAKGGSYIGISRALFDAYRKAGLHTISGVAGSVTETANLVRGDRIVPIYPIRVTSDFLPLLGIKPKLGRGFLPDDTISTGPQAVIITEAFWKLEFGGDAQALGQQLRIGDRDSVIVGILPDNPRLPNYSSSSIYLPYSQADLTVTQENSMYSIMAYARLAPGATQESAQAELRTIKPDPAHLVSKFYEDYQVAIAPHNAERFGTIADVNRYFLKNWVLLGAVGLIYLIAIANAGNLMLVRTLSRRRELAVRSALGGGRWRVLRPILVECLLLTMLATVFGFCVAKWLFSLLLALTPTATAAWEPLILSVRSLKLLGGLALLIGVVLIIFSWAQTSRFNLLTALKDGGQAGVSRVGRATRDLFVVVQTALAVVLLIGTGLLIRTYAKLLDTDYGFKIENRLVVSVSSPLQTLADRKMAQQRADRLLEGIRAMPGVRSVALGSGLVTQSRAQRKIKIVGAPDTTADITAFDSIVGVDYIETLGLRLRLGRSLAGVRVTDPPVTVITESFARKWFQGENPIGRRIAVERGPTLEIIGVVGDVRRARDEPAARYFLTPWHARTMSNSSQLVIQLRGDPSPKFESELRRAIYELDPLLVITSVRKLEAMVLRDTSNERSALIHFQALGTLALCLASFGLFAMMSYNVSQRQSEFGIRFALGAKPEDLQCLVLRRGLLLVLLGLAAGAMLAWNLTRFIQALLYNAPAFDGLTHLVVAVLLVVAGLLACWLPVRRATRVDLARLLRAE